MIPDLMTIDPTTSAELIHPLMLKQSAAREEPLMAKGTLSSDLYKGSGSHDLMIKYRSVSLGSTIPKLHHKFLRGRLVALATQLLKDSQYGGRKGGSCELPVLLVRTFGIVMKKIGMSAAPFFFDITNA